MTDHRQSKPTPAQMKLLKTLAMERGETFAMPTTKAEASQEIDRIQGREHSRRDDVVRERRQVSGDMATGFADAAAAQPHELTGYGSTAAWSDDPRPLLTVLHSTDGGTTVDGTTAGDGAATVLRQYGFRWARDAGRWHLPQSSNRPPQMRRLWPLEAALRVCGFDVELPDD
jgi:hypothetical protein